MDNTPRFEIISAHTPDDLIDMLNTLSAVDYFTVIKMYEEIDETGTVKGSLWRAIIDRSIPAVLPIYDLDEPVTALSLAA